MLTHVDTLLQFVPEHECKSCDDSNPYNNYTAPGIEPACVRCCLLRIKKDDYNCDVVAEIRLVSWGDEL